MVRLFSRLALRISFSALFLLGAGITAQTPQVYHLQGDYPFTHDPSIAKDDATYYVFATGKALGGGQFPVRCSEDLEHWRMRSCLRRHSAMDSREEPSHHGVVGTRCLL